jgi:hypoxanthine phosphoribosyltransferase
MQPDFPHRVIFTEEQIRSRVGELAREISADYRERPGVEGQLLVVSILRGGFVFLADLVRGMELDISIDFMAISGYGTSSLKSGVRIEKDLSESIYNRSVLIVEDIIDTGLTLTYILRNLRTRYPAEIRICTLLNRAVARIAPVEIDFEGFEIGHEYLVGYGLDYMQRWRNLPFLCAMQGESIQPEENTRRISSA